MAPALGSDRWCFAHDPDKRQQADAARRKGGRNRGGAVRLGHLVPPRLVSCYEVLEQAMLDVRDEKLDPRQAQAMASLARAMVATLTAGELEQRVRELEARSPSGGGKAA